MMADFTFTFTFTLYYLIFVYEWLLGFTLVKGHILKVTTVSQNMLTLQYKTPFVEKHLTLHVHGSSIQGRLAKMYEMQGW